MIARSMAPRGTSYGTYVDSVLGGVVLFALTGLFWWAWPKWWSVYVFFLGLPALYLNLPMVVGPGDCRCRKGNCISFLN